MNLRRQEVSGGEGGLLVAEADARQSPAFRLHIRRSLRMHPVLAAWVAGITFVVLVSWAMTRKPVYSAEALIYVEPLEVRVLSDGSASGYDPSRYDSYLQQQVQTVERADTLEAALSKLPAGMWSTPGESPAIGAKRLGGALKVDRVLNSYQLGIDVSAGSPEAAAAGANAIASAYLEQGRKDEHSRADQRLQLLTEERQRIVADMARDKAEQASLGRSLGVANPTGASGNPYDVQSEGLRSQLAAAREARDAVSAQLATVSGANGNGLQTAANELIAADPGLVSIRQTLSQRRAVLNDQMAGLTPANPLYKQDQEELAELDRSIERATDEARGRAERQLQDKLRLDLQRTANVEGRLNAQLAEQTAKATGAGPRLQRAAELETDLQRLSTRYATVDDAIRGLQLETGGPGQAHLALAARVPDAARPSRTRLLLLLAVPLAALFGIAAAVIARKRDPRLYLASDVQEVLGFPPMCVLPNAAEVSRAAYDEFLLRLAGALEGAYRHGGARSFVLTPAAVTATSDRFLPEVCAKLRQFGFRAGWMSAQELMPGAGWSPGPAANRSSFGLEIADSRKGLGVSRLDRLFEEYDLILIQAPALLGSALTEYAVRCTDATILLVESARTNRADLRLAAILLERLNPQGIGAILEDMPLRYADSVFREAVRAADRSTLAPVDAATRRAARESVVREPRAAETATTWTTEKQVRKASVSTVTPGPELTKTSLDQMGPQVEDQPMAEAGPFIHPEPAEAQAFAAEPTAVNEPEPMAADEPVPMEVTPRFVGARRDLWEEPLSSAPVADAAVAAPEVERWEEVQEVVEEPAPAAFPGPAKPGPAETEGENKPKLGGHRGWGAWTTTEAALTESPLSLATQQGTASLAGARATREQISAWMERQKRQEAMSAPAEPVATAGTEALSQQAEGTSNAEWSGFHAKTLETAPGEFAPVEHKLHEPEPFLHAPLQSELHEPELHESEPFATEPIQPEPTAVNPFLQEPVVWEAGSPPVAEVLETAGPDIESAEERLPASLEETTPADVPVYHERIESIAGPPGLVALHDDAVKEPEIDRFRANEFDPEDEVITPMAQTPMSAHDEQKPTSPTLTRSEPAKTGGPIAWLRRVLHFGDEPVGRITPDDSDSDYAEASEPAAFTSQAPASVMPPAGVPEPFEEPVVYRSRASEPTRIPSQLSVERHAGEIIFRESFPVEEETWEITPSVIERAPVSGPSAEFFAEPPIEIFAEPDTAGEPPATFVPAEEPLIATEAPFVTAEALSSASAAEAFAAWDVPSYEVEEEPLVAEPEREYLGTHAPEPVVPEHHIAAEVLSAGPSEQEAVVVWEQQMTEEPAAEPHFQNEEPVFEAEPAKDEIFAAASQDETPLVEPAAPAKESIAFEYAAEPAAEAAEAEFGRHRTLPAIIVSATPSKIMWSAHGRRWHETEPVGETTQPAELAREQVIRDVEAVRVPKATPLQRAGLAKAARQVKLEDGPPARASEGLTAMRKSSGIRLAAGATDTMREELDRPRRTDKTVRQHVAEPLASEPHGQAGMSRRWAMLSRFERTDSAAGAGSADDLQLTGAAKSGTGEGAKGSHV